MLLHQWNHYCQSELNEQALLQTKCAVTEVVELICATLKCFSGSLNKIQASEPQLQDRRQRSAESVVWDPDCRVTQSITVNFRIKGCIWLQSQRVDSH